MATNFAIPTTILVVVGMAEADLILNKKPPVMKPVIGGFALGIGLYAINSLDARLGTLFGALLVINALIQHGTSVFGAVNGKVKK